MLNFTVDKETPTTERVSKNNVGETFRTESEDSADDSGNHSSDALSVSSANNSSVVSAEGKTGSPSDSSIECDRSVITVIEADTKNIKSVVKQMQKKVGNSLIDNIFNKNRIQRVGSNPDLFNNKKSSTNKIVDPKIKILRSTSCLNFRLGMSSISEKEEKSDNNIEIKLTKTSTEGINKPVPIQLTCDDDKLSISKSNNVVIKPHKSSVKLGERSIRPSSSYVSSNRTKDKEFSYGNTLHADYKTMENIDGVKRIRKLKSASDLTALCSGNVQNSSAITRYQGKNFLAEIDLGCLSFYGQGSLSCFDHNWDKTAAQAVTSVKFQYLNFDDMSANFHKLKVKFPKLQNFTFEETNLCKCSQLNEIAKFVQVSLKIILTLTHLFPPLRFQHLMSERLRLSA